MRNNVTWSNGSGISATAFVNYTSGYTDDVSVPERKIDSWTTVDLSLSYRTDDRLRSIGLSGTTFSLNVQNLFDNDPPFVNNGSAFVGYDPANADPLGRFISFNIVKSW